VPAAILIGHIALMFLAMQVGVRAALAAVLGTGEHRALTVITLAGLTAGGLVLGPITQAYAFGALWTGVPFGWDLTDNKTLVIPRARKPARRHQAPRGAPTTGDSRSAHSANSAFTAGSRVLHGRTLGMDRYRFAAV
jgi:hypothetical protein